MTLTTRFTELLGCPVPIQQAGIGGMTTPNLAIAVARSGALGMLSGAAGRDALADQLDAVPPDLVVGVNFLIPFLDRPALDEAAGRARLVELFWGTPDPELVRVAHDAGALVSWQVGSVDEARTAQGAGCDLVVAQGVEAGGHVRGTTPLLSLLDDVCSVVDVPVIGAGGIGTGRDLAAALNAGADAVRIGTRFMAAEESVAHPHYVDALIGAEADDTMLTTAFGDGWSDAPHRVLRAAIEAGESLGDEQSWDPAWPSIDCSTHPEARALYAGTSVGAVTRRQPAAEIIAELVSEAEQGAD